MTLKDILRDAAVVVVAIALVFTLLHFSKGNGKTPLLGAVGSLLAENYIPYVRLNGGYNSADPMTVSGAFTASGATTLSGATSLTSTFTLGSSGTAQANQISITCAPLANNSIVASSTGYAYCTGVTGVTSSDNVLAQFASSTAFRVYTADNFWVVGAKASTTAGAIDLTIYNGTGVAAVPSAAGRAGSTTVIWASH